MTGRPLATVVALVLGATTVVAVLAVAAPDPTALGGADPAAPVGIGVPDTAAPSTAPRPDPPGSGSATPEPAIDVDRSRRDEVDVPLPVAIEIPRIGVSSVLIDLDLDDQRHLEVPADPDVAGWYVRAARPGAPGAAVIAGHVDSSRGPGVFWRLHELAPGEEIVVHGADGSAARFVVERVEQWPKDDFPTDAVYRHADGAELRLITCGGAFDRAAGSYRDNVIAFARLAADT